MKNKLMIPVWKPQGWTPLFAVQEFKKKNPEFATKKVSYAGRLDPMAEGVLLLLVDEENKKRDKYLNLRKEYKTEVILGISTDSYDALGIIYSIKTGLASRSAIETCLKSFLGKQMQEYPPYSSKTVNGKSLIWWTKNKRLSEIEIPKRQIEIYSVDLLSYEKINGMGLAKTAEEKIGKIKGNFRQKEILKSWKEFEKKYSKEGFMKIKIKVSASSGTYIRRLADDLGKKLSCGGFALSIKRTNVGDFLEKDCFRF